MPSVILPTERALQSKSEKIYIQFRVSRPCVPSVTSYTRSFFGTGLGLAHHLISECLDGFEPVTLA